MLFGINDGQGNGDGWGRKDRDGGRRTVIIIISTRTMIVIGSTVAAAVAAAAGEKTIDRHRDWPLARVLSCVSVSCGVGAGAGAGEYLVWGLDDGCILRTTLSRAFLRPAFGQGHLAMIEPVPDPQQTKKKTS